MLITEATYCKTQLLKEGLTIFLAFSQDVFKVFGKRLYVSVAAKVFEKTDEWGQRKECYTLLSEPAAPITPSFLRPVVLSHYNTTALRQARPISHTTQPQWCVFSFMSRSV